MLEDDEEINDQVKTIKVNGEFLRMLVNDILDSTRIKQGKLNMIISKFNMLDMTQECLAILQEMVRAKAKNIEIEVSCPEFL